MSLRTKIALAPLAFEATWWLCVAWLLLDVLPGKLYRRILPPARSPVASEPYDPARYNVRAHTISGVIQYMAERLPFKSMCFAQGIAADRMLKRGGIRHILHYGVLRDNSELKAHVWVTTAGQGVVGVSAARGYTEIAQYVENSPSR